MEESIPAWMVGWSVGTWITPALEPAGTPMARTSKTIGNGRFMGIPSRMSTLIYRTVYRIGREKAREKR